jgi:predicted GH43/DUF377 family glycosyl hydrolase
MRPGPVGAWNGVDVLNPSVVERGDTLYNLYSGFDGKSWHTGLATSSDGLAWFDHGKVLSPLPSSWEGDDYIAANGSVVVAGGEFLYWYQAGRLPRIGLARSYDGRRWTRSDKSVLQPGPVGSWDEMGVADPCVVRMGGFYYMFYLGQDRARRQRLGVARSAAGVQWEKLRSNPILELGEPGSFDENGLGEPAVWASRGRYWMLYTGRDRKERRRIGLAVSSDGVCWERLTASSVLSGSQPWNSQVVCDPSVLPTGGGAVRVWFGGGDVAAPAERLHGQIGFALLEPAGANLSK